MNTPFADTSAHGTLQNTIIPSAGVFQDGFGGFPGGVSWEALHPPETVESRKANDHSLVLRFARGTDSILLMGGAGLEVEKAILANPIEPAARVLLTGNHGAAGSASDDWIKLLAPEQVIVTAGRNRYGHPANELLDRLEAKEIP